MNQSADPTSFGSFFKTAIAGLLVGGIGYGGGWVYTTFAPNARLAQAESDLQVAKAELQASVQQISQQRLMLQQMEADLVASQRQIDQLSTSLRLLKVDRRIAEVRVVRQETDEKGAVTTEFVFQEIDSQGNPLDSSRSYEIAGDILYLDFLVVKFDDQYVEIGDPNRGTSFCLFHRMFGEFQEPHQGYRLDENGVRPAAYGGGEEMSAFEQQIWSRFWEIASHPQKAAQLGIRAAHGEAVSTKLVEGQRYRVTLRSSDGLSIVPLNNLTPPGDSA